MLTAWGFLLPGDNVSINDLKREMLAIAGIGSLSAMMKDVDRLALLPYQKALCTPGEVSAKPQAEENGKAN